MALSATDVIMAAEVTEKIPSPGIIGFTLVAVAAANSPKEPFDAIVIIATLWLWIFVTLANPPAKLLLHRWAIQYSPADKLVAAPILIKRCPVKADAEKALLLMVIAVFATPLVLPVLKE